MVVKENSSVTGLRRRRRTTVRRIPRWRKDSAAVNELYSTIVNVTGISVQVLDHISDKIPEFKTIRASLRQYCHRLAMEREQWSPDRQALFFYPPRLDKNEDLPTCTVRKIMQNQDNKISLNVWFYDINEKRSYTVKVSASDIPRRVVEAALISREISKGYSMVDARDKVCSQSDRLVLKLCDKEEYLLQECCIHSYEYIRNCIDRNIPPQLQIVWKDEIMKSIPDNACVILEQGEYSCMSESGISKMFVQAQLFHGDQALCESINTAKLGFNVLWEFNIAVESLPRSARLCFITFVKDKEIKPVNWVNMQVFDDNCKLITGRQVMNVTSFTEGTQRSSYPLGAPGSNLEKNSYELEFEVISPSEQDVYFPSHDDIDRLLKREDSFTSDTRTELESFERLDRIINKDPLQPMSKLEKNFLWKHRHLAKDYQPNLLPRLVECVDWTNRHNVFELYSLLRNWPEISTVTALQLIGPSYPDNRVRSIAVNTLDLKLSNELLELYLLQLVQALKLECYHNNELGRVLLRRALLHKTVGHRFFWHLRSEMHIGLSQLKFAPLLEAYCLYCGSAVLEDLLCEVETLKECKKFSSTTKDKSLEEQHTLLKAWLENEATNDKLSDHQSIMDQNIELGEISVDECKVMSSKMRPLWLTWKNRSPLGEDVGSSRVRYIVKHGDDLRQDMLVLQLIKLMDMVWKYSCRNYWITTYDCMSVDEKFGLIEVITEAKTVCDIQMHKQTGILRITGANAWLYEESGRGEGYLEAVRRFKHSCAAFCVITYILGIADRHSDNIMMKTDGQLFHIDFGHFMNHKKDKYGIKRERTPFVLTNDFVGVITKGVIKGSNKNIDNADFKSFLYLCIEAFMTIRRNGTLLLTLLSLMQHCDLPELNTMADIDYCRKCLALDKPEHEAANDFYKAIMDSYSGQWTTNIDWFLHRVNRVWQGMGSSDS
ncbi:Phosphatidylinositol 4 [Mactra antiquata]